MTVSTFFHPYNSFATHDTAQTFLVKITIT